MLKYAQLFQWWACFTVIVSCSYATQQTHHQSRIELLKPTLRVWRFSHWWSEAAPRIQRPRRHGYPSRSPLCMPAESHVHPHFKETKKVSRWLELMPFRCSARPVPSRAPNSDWLECGQSCCGIEGAPPSTLRTEGLFPETWHRLPQMMDLRYNIICGLAIYKTVQYIQFRGRQVWRYAQF